MKSKAKKTLILGTILSLGILGFNIFMHILLTIGSHLAAHIPIPFEFIKYGFAFLLTYSILTIGVIYISWKEYKKKLYREAISKGRLLILVGVVGILLNLLFGFRH